MKIFKINGIYKDLGKISFTSSKLIDWSELTEEKPPIIPFGSKIELTISIDETTFLEGNDGIVWATYHLRQAEIIKDTLMAQNINCEIIHEVLTDVLIFFIKINSESDIKDAINFIWKTNSGLRLKPDWHYNRGEQNLSFELWLSGH